MARQAKRKKVADPDLKDGIDYWRKIPATVDGVLGGYGNGSLPRVDALTSRLFLLSLLPELSTVPSAIRPLQVAQPTRRTRAVDVGAGIGRVTASVLLPLVQDVLLVEPTPHFVREAHLNASAAVRITSTSKGAPQDSSDGTRGDWGPRASSLVSKEKSVTFLRDTLQGFNPIDPIDGSFAEGSMLGRVGHGALTPSSGDAEEGSKAAVADDDKTGFDVFWCQWCLGHISDSDIVPFFQRAQKSLRLKSRGTGDLEGVIIVKENCCSEPEPGAPNTSYDETDSSVTRSDSAWKKIFRDAGLTLIKEEVQLGFPEDLYMVKMYALR